MTMNLISIELNTQREMCLAYVDWWNIAILQQSTQTLTVASHDPQTLHDGMEAGYDEQQTNPRGVSLSVLVS